MLKGKIQYLDAKEVDEELVNNLTVIPGITPDTFKRSSSVNTNYIDNDIFEFALDEVSALKERTMKEDEETPFFKKLSEDLFHALYKPQPEVFDKEDVYSSLAMEHDIVKDILSHDKIELLRSNTVGDLFNSTLSLHNFQDKAKKIIAKWVSESEENQKAMDDMNEAIQDQNDMQKLLDALGDDPNNKSLQNSIKNMQKKVQQSNSKASQGKGATGLGQQLNKSMGQVQQEVQQANDALNTFGLGNDCDGQNGGGAGNSGGAFERIDFASKKQLLDAVHNSSKFKDIIKHLGRIQEDVAKMNKRPSNFGQTVSDIGLGNNLKKVLSTEKVKLVEPDLETQFFKKFTEKGLLEYKTNGEELSKGPIIVCIDDSGSMSGSRDAWAKAVAIASIQIAIKEKRNARAILFSSNVDEVFDFPKGDVSFQKIVDLGESFYGGGTNFHEPLEKSLEAVEESEFKKADILFITDGDPFHHLDDDFLRKINSVKEAKDLKINTILIGDVEDEYVKPFSDTITTLEDLNENGDLVSVFKNMQR